MDSNKISEDVKVLIVDDEKDICYMLGMVLKRKNHESTYANSLQEAEKALVTYKPNLIFLDNNLPDGLGVNYISHLKKNHPDAKIIMITAHDAYLDRKKAIEIGADEFIGKPFSVEKIYSTIDALSA